MSAPEPGWSTPAIVTRVIDGDTVEVQVVRTFRVRLLDCWAPESRSKDLDEKQRGLEAKKYLEGVVAAAKGVCTVLIPTQQNGDLLSVMTLGRLLGRIWMAGSKRSLSELQVGAGKATVAKGVLGAK